MIEGTACYLSHDGKTLMLHRDKKPNDIMEGYWSVPGGKLKPSETPVHCIIREFKEETGLALVQPKYRGAVNFINHDKDDDWRVYFYTCTQSKGKRKDVCKEGTLEWKATESLPGLHMRPGDQIILPWIFDGLYSGRIFEAQIIHKKEKLIGQRVMFSSEER